LPCYCYTLKINVKAIRSQVWQSAPGLPGENFNKKLNSAKKKPEKEPNQLIKSQKKNKLYL